MPNDPNLERRMSRFENETVAIYELIDDFRSETQTRFDEARTRFDRIDDFRSETQTRFDRIETTLGEVLQRLPEPT